MELLAIISNINSFEEFDCNGTNNPILRRNNIFKCMEESIEKLKFISIDTEIDHLWLETIHDSKYLLFLKESYNSFIKSDDRSWNNGNNGLIPCNFCKHNFDIPFNLPMYKLSGIYGTDTMTPIYANTWHSATVSANQAYEGANYSVKGYNVVYILTTSPGHHAKRAEYGGYCFINNAIVAAKRLLELGKNKIGILDLDYHAGNGTYELTNDLKIGTNEFYPSTTQSGGLDKIVAYSIHCDPIYDYPSFEGKADKYNYTLGPNCDWPTYKKVLIEVCQKIKNDNIDTLIIAFGGDTFKLDLDALPIGRFNLDVKDYIEMGKVIKEKFSTIPIIITQEGGYNMDHIGEIVTSFIKGIT